MTPMNRQTLVGNTISAPKRRHASNPDDETTPGPRPSRKLQLQKPAHESAITAKQSTAISAARDPEVNNQMIAQIATIMIIQKNNAGSIRGANCYQNTCTNSIF